MLNWDGTLVDFGGATLAWNGAAFQAHAGVPVESLTDRSYPKEILFACGGAMMIDRDVYREVGGFDHDYFAYLEDVDLGWRLWLLGFRVGFCRDAIVCHRHNATSRLFPEYRKDVLIERNALFTIVKNYDAVSLGAALPGALLLAIKRAALRSGIPRGDYAFRTSSDRRSAVDAPRTSLPRAVFNVYGMGGMRGVLRRAGIRTATAVLERWSPERGRLGENSQPIRRDSYARIVAIEDFLDHVPRLMEKREIIQARRVRSDAELSRLFRTPFKVIDQPPSLRDDYERAHALVLDELGIRSFFGGWEAQQDADTSPAS
jgi:hypothetical protein